MFRQPMQKTGSLAKLWQQEATALNVASPKGISIKSHGKLPVAQIGGDLVLGLQRRRLFVDNNRVDVMGAASIGNTDSSVQALGDGTCAVVALAGLSKKGYAPYNPRKKNQDALVIQFDQKTQSLLLCVFDGHGEAGDSVSGAIRDAFATTLFAHAHFKRSGEISKDAKWLQTAISDTLRLVEQMILNDLNIETEFSGTTAVVTVIRENLVVVGNVGDSRITRGFLKGLDLSGSSPALACQELSIDHKPDRPDERTRILASGGRVFAVEYDDGIDGPPRVWLDQMDVPGLAMSRSLGDAVAHTAGVLSDPEFTTHWLDEHDRCLIIATDGLWEFMSNEECIKMAMEQQNPKVAVDRLVVEATRRWMKEEQVIDDSTIIVAYVDTTRMIKTHTNKTLEIENSVD